jgi:hypothetical protein
VSSMEIRYHPVQCHHVWDYSRPAPIEDPEVLSELGRIFSVSHLGMYKRDGVL